jgi:hypothetical protein
MSMIALRYLPTSWVGLTTQVGDFVDVLTGVTAGVDDVLTGAGTQTIGSGAEVATAVALSPPPPPHPVKNKIKLTVLIVKRMIFTPRVVEHTRIIAN